ncbi:hypothetical protein [Turicimonas muris]|uniref:hypothetical protein n=1 Tax=Turicimonas muris TaxID=1796652 RepID=UPI0026769C48|nr:hypothetical protein [Turicimonas muris]
MANLTPLVRIVDDDPTICDSQSFFLQLAGWQTVTYQDPVTFFGTRRLGSAGMHYLGCENAFSLWIGSAAGIE